MEVAATGFGISGFGSEVSFFEESGVYNLGFGEWGWGLGVLGQIFFVF